MVLSVEEEAHIVAFRRHTRGTADGRSAQRPGPATACEPCTSASVDGVATLPGRGCAGIGAITIDVLSPVRSQSARIFGPHMLQYRRLHLYIQLLAEGSPILRNCRTRISLEPKKPGRKPLTDGLPRERVEYDLHEDQNVAHAAATACAGKPRDEDTEGGNQPLDESLINSLFELHSPPCAGPAKPTALHTCPKHLFLLAFI